MSRNGVDSEFYKRAYYEHTYRSKFEKFLTDMQPILISPYPRLLKLFGDIKGKHICEIGCGNGKFANTLALLGAYVSASDISPDAINEAKELNKGLNVNLQVMDARHLTYDNESFDYVVGFGILHHVDLSMATKEIIRILKPNGVALFDEPLAHNPIANLWRKFTPSTKDINEHPLSYTEIRQMSEYFSSVEYQEYNLLPMLSSIAYLLTMNQNIKYKSAMYLAKLEPPLLKIRPLRRYCASIQIKFTKAGLKCS
jgi:2-polyprenyl-3-methyl-5-hydroxy-6-metoxy-1,4-benzoquinol methylase